MKDGVVNPCESRHRESRHRESRQRESKIHGTIKAGTMKDGTVRAGTVKDGTVRGERRYRERRYRGAGGLRTPHHRSSAFGEAVRRGIEKWMLRSQIWMLEGGYN